MSRQSGTGELGFFLLRDHAPVEHNQRNVLGATQGADRGANPENRSDSAGTYGDIQGGMLWPELDGRRDYTHAWFLTGPSLFANTKQGTTTDKAWSLQFDAADRDERFLTQDLSAPEWFRGRWPNSHPALGSVGTKENEQVDLVHPSFFGLFSPQKFGPADCGTPIYDLDDESKPDKERQVQLQQWMRVADLGPAGLCGFTGYVPAMQLGFDSLERKSGGLALADGNATGITNAAAGGPFTLGVGQCVHQKAGPDGPVMPVHLSTSSLFLGLEHDGQLHFEPDPVDWVGMKDDGIPTRVHMGWEPTLPTLAGCQRSAGRWVWYTRQSHFVGDPPKQDKRRQFALIDYSRRIGGDPGGVITGGDPGGTGTGVIVDGFEQITSEVTETFVVPERFRQGPEVTETFVVPERFRKPPTVSDGSKPTYATSPYCQTAPGYVFKAQNPTKGLPVAASDLNSYAAADPNVAALIAFSTTSGDEFVVKNVGDPNSHPTGQGGFMILPPDVDPFAVIRGETVTSDYTPQVMIPTGLAQLAFGDPTSNGKAGTGVVMETGTGGRLDFKTVDSSGTVTATAYIPSGASGDISGAAGSGDVTGPAGATAGNIPQLDATGKVISDSGIAAADVVEVSGAKTQDDVLAWDASGNAVSSGVQYDEIIAPTSGGAYSFIQRNGGDSAWASDTLIDARHDPNSTSWNDPAAFIQNTDNQASAEYLPALELAAPNHAYSGFVGGTGMSITGYGGTPMAGAVGKRTGSLAGDFYLGGTEGGSPTYSGRFFANYSSTDGFAVEGDGFMGVKDVLSSDPTPTLTSGTDYGFLYMKDGSFYGRNVDGDPFALGPTAGEAITGLADDGIHEFGEGYVSYEQTLPTSGSAAVTISNVIRAPSLVDDVSVVIKTAIPTSGGITSVQVGDGTTAARFGTFTTFAKNDSTTWEDWATETPPIANTTSGATDVVLTPVGGSWDAPAGVVVIGVRSGYVTLATYA